MFLIGHVFGKQAQVFISLYQSMIIDNSISKKKKRNLFLIHNLLRCAKSNCLENVDYLLHKIDNFPLNEFE